MELMEVRGHYFFCEYVPDKRHVTASINTVVAEGTKSAMMFIVEVGPSFRLCSPLAQEFILLHEAGHVMEKGGWGIDDCLDHQIKESAADRYALRILGVFKFYLAIWQRGRCLNEDPIVTVDRICRQFIKEVKK